MTTKKISDEEIETLLNFHTEKYWCVRGKNGDFKTIPVRALFEELRDARERIKDLEVGLEMRNKIISEYQNDAAARNMLLNKAREIIRFYAGVDPAGRDWLQEVEGGFG